MEETAMDSTTHPTRSLPERADLDQLKRQAKDLLRAAQAGEPGAVERLGRRPAPRLADAQFVLAREYGFASWPRTESVDRSRWWRSPRRSCTTSSGADDVQSGQLPRCGTPEWLVAWSAADGDGLRVPASDRRPPGGVRRLRGTARDGGRQRPLLHHRCGPSDCSQLHEPRLGVRRPDREPDRARRCITVRDPEPCRRTRSRRRRWRPGGDRGGGT